MPPTIKELIAADRIQHRVSELGDRVSRDYAGRDVLLLVGVLNGAMVFLSDLMRRLAVPVEVDFLRAASYGASTQTTGVVQIRKDLETSVTGRDVLLIEDIVDTGLTLDFLVAHLSAGRPKSLEVCTLLDKPSRRLRPLPLKYIGFEIGDVFVVGYGMDYNERYRELPAIHYLDPPPGDLPTDR